MPFDIPESWKWVRLSQCIQVNPTVQCKDETDVSFIPMAAVEAGYSSKINLEEKRKWIDVKNNFSRFAEYDVLVAKITPCFQNRKSAIAKGLLNNYGAGTTEFNVLRTTESLYNKFVLFFVKSAYFIDYGQEHFTGTAGQQRFGGASLREMLFPLPPLAEQKRIVAKLESYLAIIDKAEELIERKANLDEEIRNKILDLAIRGKLVEQRPEEGTAEELYAQIQKEKNKLIAEGKIKKEKPLPEITDDEMPFDIPESWKWVRWGNLSQKIQYGLNASALTSGKIKFVRISDIHDNSVDWDNVPYCDASSEEICSYELKKNDILFARTGGTVGKSYIVNEVPEPAVFAGYLIRTQYGRMLEPYFLKFFMESSLYWAQLRNGVIATAQPNCNGQTLSKMLVPLPPLTEQKRIVAKIEELLPYCDKLK